ncbi:hypothetical protein [Cytobacillus massiliigabonensis]|uniref:hypothetical protein n=1 Tax=Cytobacillus massiliigabonensis TaxID=1871011 RepID=UPI000C8669F5|nr:hypothetical protein [Cytobacillus massiliigabonensis]
MVIKIRTNCGSCINLHESLRKPLKLLLPFAMHIQSLIFQGEQHRLKFIEASIKIKIEEFKKIIDNPTHSTSISKQWFNITSLIYGEAILTSQYINKIQCNQGEITWDKYIEIV